MPLPSQNSRRGLSSSKIASRLAILPRAAISALKSFGRRHAPSNPRRILIAHHLLLGDTLMLTALIARLRSRYPHAEIVMTVTPAQLPLYTGAPYGVQAVGWDPRDVSAFRRLQRAASASPFDLAIVPGDNRHALLARALGARWIVALAGDRPAWKNRIADELVALPREPRSLADMFASLAGDDTGAVFDAKLWPQPEYTPFTLPPSPYAVLHVGAGSPLRLWEAEKWRFLATHLAAKGLHIVWSAGPGEEAQVNAITGESTVSQDTVLAGRLDLAQLWHLLANACILVALDSGVAHLAKHTGTPTVCLFGPGSATLFGKGRFWRDAPFRAVTVDEFPCRDQITLFKRDISWVRRCQRIPGERRTATTCALPDCMRAIDVAAVTAAADALLASELQNNQGGRNS